MQNLVIPFAFLLLSVVLIWVVIGARGYWWLKLGLMILTLLVSFEIWTSLDSYFGHSKSTTIAAMHGQQALLFWVRVEEPDTNEPGGIYMWLKPDKEAPSGAMAYSSAEPRVFEFPYSRALHETVQTFMDQILKRNGEPIEIAFRQSSDKEGKNKQVNLGHEGEESDKSGSMSLGQAMVYALPPRKLPPKVTQ